jgi:ABC-type glycerol-3-phosphate transport system substrate-binding protein
MSKRKNVFIAVFLVLVMSLLAACGGGASSGNANSANLTVWGMGAEGDSLKILATIS